VRYGDRIQIVNGLSEGERLVVSGLFLLDSESRLQMAAARVHDKPKAAGGSASDPVCGMSVALKDGPQSEFDGATYHFCSKSCKEKFDATPSRFASRQAAGGPRGGRS